MSPSVLSRKHKTNSLACDCDVLGSIHTLNKPFESFYYCKKKRKLLVPAMMTGEHEVTGLIV